MQAVACNLIINWIHLNICKSVTEYAKDYTHTHIEIRFILTNLENIRHHFSSAQIYHFSSFFNQVYFIL